jgi:hypothetical protein
MLMLQLSLTWTYPMPHLQRQVILHTLHIYKLNIKNVTISLSTITYKKPINIGVFIMIGTCPTMYGMFLLGKNITRTNEMLMLQLSFTWMYPMSHLQKHLIFHTLHNYKLNMKNVNISLSTITYKRHINIVQCTMIKSCLMMYEMFLLGKKICMTNKMLMLQLSFIWMYQMPHPHIQLILHTLHNYK